MRDLVVKLAGAIILSLPVWFCQGLLGLSGFLSRVAKIAIVQKRLGDATRHPDQSALLREVVAKCGQRAAYLEFGVWRGESMQIAIDGFAGRDVDFFGFDSFEGLPEDWNRYFGKKMAAGSFDTGGSLPEIGHNRVTFIKGWFEDTLPGFLRAQTEITGPERDIVLYLDADLYHPTLFVLHRIAGCREHFFVLCDDWTGGVCEAVYDFAQTSSFRMTFIGQVRSEVHGLPKKVSLLLTQAGGPASPNASAVPT
jgi:hypothetical protein